MAFFASLSNMNPYLPSKVLPPGLALPEGTTDTLPLKELAGKSTGLVSKGLRTD